MKASFNIPFINEHLLRGERKKLAEESGISYQYACDCLSEKKKSFHLEFMTRCETVAFERASIRVARKEQTQSLKTVLQ